MPVTVTCASARPFFALRNNVHTVSATRGVAHAPSGTSKRNEQDCCSYFVKRHPLPGGKLSSAVKTTWGRVGIKPLGAQRTPKTTSAALLAPPQEDIGSKVAKVWSFVFPGVPSWTAAFPVGMKTFFSTAMHVADLQ